MERHSNQAYFSQFTFSNLRRVVFFVTAFYIPALIALYALRLFNILDPSFFSMDVAIPIYFTVNFVIWVLYSDYHNEHEK